ncbi:dTMP kinase [Psychrobacter sp. I-STPA10]|uniref:dTMP kinase n=1 Tax=Psychrobacter sp. I-STPA10 TaxID=2585769 RepID=UPI001E63C023|nr:dTMP kinase [Psychrobacter sp. I-STPA10]
MTARFISFEGTEGVGKTTAITQLCEYLQQQGQTFIRTREPGGSVFAEKLRELLLAPESQIDDDTELLLMFAARCDHINTVILPALEAGKWVICDRFIDSSIAYQGFGRGYGEKKTLSKIQSLITQFVPKLPDCTLWLDLPVAEGMQRAAKRSTADRFEQEAVAFFNRVHQGYDHQWQHYPERIQRIDASGDVQSVTNRVIAAISAIS